LKINHKQLVKLIYFNFVLGFKTCFLIILPPKAFNPEVIAIVQMKFIEKHNPVKIEVVLLLAVYIFVSLTNLYFVERHTHNFNNKYSHSFLAKRKTKNMFRLQKASSTTFSQTETQYKQISQKAALFFIVLLFASGTFMTKKSLFPHSNQLIPDYQYAFLRYRSIQI